MRWYVLQTKTGGEEKLVGMIQKLLPSALYGECFVIYYEQLWRRHEQSFVHVARAFPGYVFITSDEPDSLYLELKRVPAMSKLIADDSLYFLALEAAEEEFLARILSEKHVIRLSYLATDGHGHVRQTAGPLRTCLKQVVRYNYRKRSAAVRLRLAGSEKQILLGFVLPEDIRRQLRYGKVEAPIAVSEHYQVCLSDQPDQEEDKKHLQFQPGDRVTVMGGDLAGMTGIVSKMRKHTVKLSIHFLGQQLDIEIAAADVQKLE